MQAYVTIEGLLPLIAVGVAFVLLLITVLSVPSTSKPGWMVLRPRGNALVLLPWQRSNVCVDWLGLDFRRLGTF